MPTPSGHTDAIRASTVIDTNVKDRRGNKIGEIEDVMLDKTSNHIMYAVVSFGGFLGLGEKYHPLPWEILNYDPVEDAYVIDVTKQQLEAAPADSIEELTSGDGTRYRDLAYDYYKTPRYWDTLQH